MELDSERAEFGRTLVFCGKFVLLASIAAPMVLFVSNRGNWLAVLAAWGGGLVLSLVLGVFGVLLVSYGRRLQVPSGASVLEQAGPIVCFLRSFSADATSMPGTDFEQASLPTREEALMAQLEVVGRMVAIGRPREPLPALGAPRIYATDAEWQAKVIGLMHRSRLTVIAFGASSGLRWELETALDHVVPERLLLWFPTRESWKAFLAFADGHPRWRLRRPTLQADVRFLAFQAPDIPRVLDVHDTVVGDGDFSYGTLVPDPTNEGDVSPGGVDAYLSELPPI